MEGLRQDGRRIRLQGTEGNLKGRGALERKYTPINVKCCVVYLLHSNLIQNRAVLAGCNTIC